MPLSGPQLLRSPSNVYPWQPVDNFHVVENEWADEPRDLYRGDLQANAKYLSHTMPGPGQNPGISTGWGCYFKLCAATDNFYFMIGNQAVMQQADANIRGYGVQVNGTTPAITVERIDGNATNVVLGTYVWTPDTNLHCLYFTREVSGANRFFRGYYGSLLNDLALVIGPTATDATYTDFSHWGWDHLTHDRIVVGGEWCQS